MNKNDFIVVGSHAWKQIHANKLTLLYQYDLSKIYSKGRIVETSHGPVAEALFRKWLENFLPTKYGVTAGYIVSQNNSFDKVEKLNHFDVIIYDKLNSPVLWIEENKDRSIQGMDKAIPAEFVLAVIEVKANLTKHSSSSAMKKLNQLIPYLSSNIDKKNDYSGKLPPKFFCTTVYFELTKLNDSRKVILDNLIPNLELGRSIYGGIILRSEHNDISQAGKIILMSGDKIPEINSFNGFSLSESLIPSREILLTNNKYFCVSISWSQLSFVDFMFDIIKSLEGKYKSGYASSFYGAVWNERKSG